MWCCRSVAFAHYYLSPQLVVEEEEGDCSLYLYIFLWGWGRGGAELYMAAECKNGCMLNIIVFLLSGHWVQVPFQHTAKTKYRNFETNVPIKGISGSQSQFQHSCVCEWFIYSHDRSAYSLKKIWRPILGLYNSLTDTWMWKLGLRPRYSQKRNT